MENKETFNFTYSAKDQEEIKAIRKKYITPVETEDKMSYLRRIDAAVTQKATIFSLVFGIIGTLVLGIGMSLIMTDIGKVMGLIGGMEMLIGILLGIIGIVLVCIAYPAYNHIIKTEREKIAPEIIRITDELMK